MRRHGIGLTQAVKSAAPSTTQAAKRVEPGTIQAVKRAEPCALCSAQEERRLSV